MSRKYISILTFFMTLSLFIFVGLQIYFISEVIKAGEQDFSSRVYQALKESSNKIADNELKKIYYTYKDLAENVTKKDSNLTKIVLQSVEDSGTTRYLSYSKNIVQRKPTSIKVTPTTTLKLAPIYSDQGTIKIQKDTTIKSPPPLTTELENDHDFANYTLKEYARLVADKEPIEKRVNLEEVKYIVHNELKQRGLDVDFRVALLDNKLNTTLISDTKYDKKKNNYKVLLFNDSKDKPLYFLAASFPDKTVSVLERFWVSMLITLITMIIIVLVYIASIYYMNKQKMISEIKTDFINNMSHEFKTPIATINLATDALKNPVISNNSDKVKYYSDLIKQENKRMSKQVEMVLRMSKLERNELEFHKKEVNMRQLIIKCMESMKMIVEKRNGIIIDNFTANHYIVNVDEFHMENAIINLLDNANKYSPENPKINITTYNENSHYVIEISDNGIGMEPSVLKKIFEKFYREETGNIHNVKGHGLGLTYVKKIIDQHNGEIIAKSEKGKGSTFTIKLPLT